MEPPVRRVVEPVRVAAGFLPPDPDAAPAGDWWAVRLDPAG
jgi:hypothetical protein